MSEERIAIIADGCNVSQAEAEKLYREQMAAGEWSAKIDKLRQQQRDQRMRKMQHSGFVDRKLLASGG